MTETYIWLPEGTVVPEGWSVERIPADEYTTAHEVLVHDGDELGEYGCIAWDPDTVGGWFCPGASPAFQIAHETLAGAVAQAESNRTDDLLTANCERCGVDIPEWDTHCDRPMCRDSADA